MGKTPPKISVYINNDIENSGLGNCIEEIFKSIPNQYINTVNINNVQHSDINVIEMLNNYKNKYGNMLNVYNFVTDSIPEGYNYMLNKNRSGISLFVRPYVSKINAETVIDMLNQLMSSNDIGVVGCKTSSKNSGEVTVECVNMFDRYGLWFDKFTYNNTRPVNNGKYNVEAVSDSMFCIKTSNLDRFKGFDINYDNGLYVEDISLNMLSVGYTNVSIDKGISEDDIKRSIYSENDYSYFNNKWIDKGSWLYAYPD